MDVNNKFTTFRSWSPSWSTRAGRAQTQRKRSPHPLSLSSSQKIKCEIQWCKVILSLSLCNSSKTIILL